MSHLSPFIPHLRGSEIIGQGVPSRQSQRCRYAPFPYYVYQLQVVNNSKPGTVTDHRIHSSTSSTITRFSTYFISAGRFFYTKTSLVIFGSWRAGNGSSNDGGTSSHMFAEDGDISYLGLHPTLAFACFPHTEHQ